MERGILKEPDVVELLQQFEDFEVYTDAPNEAKHKQAMKSLTGIISNPIFLVLDSKNHLRVVQRGFTNSKEEFKEFLRTGLTDEPAFESRLIVGDLIPMEEQFELPIPLELSSSLQYDAGEKAEYKGKNARAYTSTFAATQKVKLPGDLPSGRYKIRWQMLTATYDGDKWLQAFAPSFSAEFTVK